MISLDIFFGFYITFLAIVVAVVILLDNRKSHQTYAWLIVIVLLPVVGLLLYLLFGRNWRRNNRFRKKRTAAIYAQTSQWLAPVIESDKDNIKRLRENMASTGWDKLLAVAYAAPYMMPLSVKTIRLYTNGVQKFEDLIADINTAQYFVHMEYYIYESDVTTRKIFDALIERSEQGIEVRVFFDSLGSIAFKLEDRRRLRKAGVKVRSGRSPLDKINYRSHRKLVVIDAKIAYIGGMNMAEHYATGGKFDHWRDAHLRLEGKIAAAIQELFTKYWLHATGEDLNQARYQPLPDNDQSVPHIMVQLIHSGADTEWETVRQVFEVMIASARKTIFLQTPYFIPPETLNSALINAALGGIKVTIILAGISDNMMSKNASFTYFKELLTAGVEIHLYEKGFMHGKSMTIDSTICTVGSSNLDPRSMSINYEANLIIYDETFTRQLEQGMISDLDKCRQVTLKEIEGAGLFQRLKWSLLRLMEPLL